MNKAKKISTIFIITLSLILSFGGCTHHHQIVKRRIHIRKKSELIAPEFIPARPVIKTPPPITIWVHGTNFFRRGQFSQYFEGVPSLKPAIGFEQGHKYRDIALALYQQNRKEFPFHSCYFFGWSGNLNATERKKTAAYLYCEILQLIDQYKKTYKKCPIIRIFSHSHGGSVVLHMTRFIDRNKPEIVIEEFIPLAIPVQALTRKAPHHPMFKRVYNLYATADLVQIIAPEMKHGKNKHIKGLKFPPFSSRTFPHHAKMIQAKIKINGRSIGHHQFVRLEFIASLPAILQELRTISQKENNNFINKEILISVHQKQIAQEKNGDSSTRELAVLNVLPEQ